MNIRVTAGKLNGQPGRVVDLKSKDFVRAEIALPENQYYTTWFRGTGLAAMLHVPYFITTTKLTLHTSEYEVM